MSKKGFVILAMLVLFIGAIVGGIVFFVPGSKRAGSVAASGSPDSGSTSAASGSSSTPLPAIQQELNELSSKMVTQLKSEERLNLNMVAHLRSYQEMMRQIEGYASEVERNLDLIEEISKDEFQQDVKLQASLFAGKKASLVAQHLEEFRASRVGAILAKMKKKEASVVLDTWAKQDSVKVAAFYREVMAAYLNNRRRDENPELFNKLGKQAESSRQSLQQTPPVR